MSLHRIGQGHSRGQPASLGHCGTPGRGGWKVEERGGEGEGLSGSGGKGRVKGGVGVEG